MLAISCGGNHCAYVFGMMEQLFIDDPTCDWKDLAGNSSGALICAGVAQTRNNSEYINMVDSLYSTMCKKDIAKEWSPFGSFFNYVHSFLFHDSMYRDTLTPLVSSKLDYERMKSSGRTLHIGVYNETKGRYETMSGVKDMLNPICASASVPGIFPPREISGDFYVDGGIKHVVPTPAIIKWCEENQGNIDIMICYPITSYQEFKKTEFSKSRFKLMNVMSDTMINLMWNNLDNDIAELNRYFKKDIRKDRVFKNNERRVRIFAPGTGFYSSFLSKDVHQLETMFNHGKDVVKQLVKQDNFTLAF